MSFRITGLAAGQFEHLFGLPDDDLARRNARRCIADAPGAFPDRIELRHAAPGESLLLVNHTHQPADNPYRAAHAVFVLEGARTAFDRVGVVPEVLRPRVLSLRAFDASHLMVDADLVDGREVESLIQRLLADPQVAYVHAHYARRGCYACRIDRLVATCTQ
jgi:hypothetical protein